MVPRLIIVSNRVAVPDPKGPRQAGGLAVAVNAALKQREGIWFGWSGRVGEDGTGRRTRRGRERHSGRSSRSICRRATFRNITTASPTACCGRSSITASISPSSPRSSSPSYLRVNALFADALSPYHPAGRRHLGARLPPAAAGQGTAGARPRQSDRLLPPYPLPAARHPDGAAAARRDDRGARPLRPCRSADRG